MKKIKQCLQCGSKDFYIVETLNHKAWLDNDGILHSKNINGEFTEIGCAKCGAIYQEENFKDFDDASV